MTIQVRVVSNRAQAQMAALQAQQAGLSAGIRDMNRQEPLGRRHITSLMKFGNQLQWTGRMLQYNFSIPIAAAGAAATFFALEQEKAFVHVSKVYGDTEAAARQFRKEMGLGMREARKLAESYKTDELEALDRAFTAISEHYGVQKKEVNEVAGAWAAAGASGLDLAEAVNQTMKAIIIGDMNAMTATKALISIQAQYKLSTEELEAVLANLNSVENQTGASMGDLIIGFEKAAGVARTAGVETQQLAAYMAALVPATGSAATAGNALKTIMSRLLSPTKETTQVLGAMGINVKDLSWQSATITERLDIMAGKFTGLGKAAQGAASSVIASRWQVNRFEVLMRELVDTTGHYANALKAADDQGDSFKRMQEELNTVLESNPRRMERMWVMLQNASVEIIQPLIPHIIYLADRIAAMARAFADLNPETQKLVLFMLLLLAAVGPVVRYMGALTTLVGTVGHGFVVLASVLGATVGLLGTIAGLILSPFRKAFTVLATFLGGTQGLLLSAADEWKRPFIGLRAFWSRWIGWVAVLFTTNFIAIGTFVAKWWIVQVGIWRAALAMKMIMLTAFVAKFRMAMVLASLTGLGTWGSFWAAMKLMTVTGLATQFALFRKAMGLVAIIKTLGMAIVVAWRTTWAMVFAVNAAGWALLRAQWIVGALTGVGIWGRFRAAFIVIHATAAAAALTIWKGFIGVFIATSRAGVAGFIGIMKGIIPFLLRWGKFLVSPWTIAVLAIMGVIYAFRDQIQQVWTNIVNYLANESSGISRGFQSLINGIIGLFNKLPQGVQNAMMAVVTVVRDAALAVYEWFSYINPFARHSPSLVENVTRGMDTILGKFSKLGQIKKYTDAAYAEIKRFGDLTAKLGLSAAKAEQAANRKSLKKAGAGGAVASYDRLVKIMNKLTPIANRLSQAIAAQEKVVDRWQNKLDEANDELDKQQDKLDRLQEKLTKYQDLLAGAEAELDRFASAPLQGMQAMEDQIFANQMAQTRLRYEMMQMEDAVGSFDDIKEKMEAINGLQEIFRGEQANLRAAGAGSEILGQYDAEINKLQDQKQVYDEATQKMSAMQAQLEKLQREAEKLDLVKAMKFDELQYQIDKAANSTKEMSFEEIMNGIAGAKEQIAIYTPLVEQATAAVEKQEEAVQKATDARDRIQDQLDIETAKLDGLRQKYDEVNAAIQAIEQSINDVLAAADKLDKLNKAKDDAKKKKKKGAGADPYISPGLQNFLDAGKATFPDPGGKGIPPRTDWSNQADLIDKFTEDLAADTAKMFDQINPFKPLKAKAQEVWEWIKDKAQQAADKVGEFFGAAFEGVDGGGVLQKIKGKIEPILEFITGAFKDLADFFGAIWDLLWPQVKKIGEGVWKGLQKLWEEVGPKLGEFKELWGPIGDAMSNAWTIIKPILAFLAGGLAVAFSVLLAMIGEAIGPAIEAIGTILGGLIDLVKGVVKIIVGIFTLDLGMILDGVGDIFSGLWGVIEGVFVGGVRIVWNLVQGFVFGVRDFFIWLWDQVDTEVGGWWDGIKDAWNNIASGVADWWTDKVWGPISNGISTWWDNRKSDFKGWWGDIKDAWGNITNNVKTWWFDNIWNPVTNGISNWWDARMAVWRGWWSLLKDAWNNISTNVKTWWFDNIWNPVTTGISNWWDNRLVVWRSWWEAIKAAWSNITENIQSWWFNNIWNPVTTGIANWWGNRIAQFSGWWGEIKAAWGNFIGEDGVGGWWKKHVTDPIYNKITGVWDDIKKYFTDNPDLLKNAIKPVVNGVITGVNTIIKGLNKVSDVLPGDLWNINEIPPMLAAGGMPNRKANRGFVTSGARAIVGEGKANYPEFVIPTDPTHRNRAKSLLAMAAQKMGIQGAATNVRNAKTTDGHGIPMFGIGGWLADKWDDTKNLGKKIANLPKQAVGSIMNKILDGAAKMIDRIGYQPVESPPEYGISKLRSWVTDFDDNIAKKLDSMTPVGGSVPVANPSSPGAQQYWGGGLFTRKFVAHMERAEELAGSSIQVYQGGFRPSTSYSGTSHQGDALDMQVNYALLNSLRRVGIATGDRTGLGDWKAHMHAVPGPGAGYGAGSATWQWQDYIARGGASQSPTSPWGLKSGAIAKRGSNADIRVGDGRYDEAVVPLPYGWQNLRGNRGGDTYNFYGDLEFPNIKTGDDAELFIQNLENVARD